MQTTFQSWLREEERRGTYFAASPATSIAGQLSAVKAAVVSQDARNGGLGLVATHLLPDVAYLACDFHKGLCWFSEVDGNGSKTGLLGLVYSYDPSTPHQLTLACFKEAFAYSIRAEVGVGQDFYVRSVSSRRIVEEDVTKGRREDAQFYGRGQNLAEDKDGYGVCLQVAFLNQSHKQLVEDCFFSVHGTMSTQVAIGVRVHTLTDSTDRHSPVQYFIFGISWLACLDRFVFHGGIFSGDSSECQHPGMAKYSIATRVDPVVANTSKAGCAGMLATMDVHAIC